jgi:hypothetical protein
MKAYCDGEPISIIGYIWEEGYPEGLDYCCVFKYPDGDVDIADVENIEIVND